MTTKQVRMKCVGRLAILVPLLSVAACATPEYRWVKQGVDQKTFAGDRNTCVKYVNDEFNPYYDYGPVYGYQPVSSQIMYRSIAAEEMFRACMYGKGYERITIQPDEAKKK